MKNLAILTVGVCLILSSATVAQETPKPGPEHKRMESWLGKWTCEYKGDSGTSTSEQTCEWFGDGFFMVCTSKSKSTAGTREVRLVAGYNRNEKAYTMYRYFSTGWSDFSKGWVRDKTWTWVLQDFRVNDKLRRVQCTLKESTGMFTLKWERSVEGEPWKVTSEGKCTKVKDTTN